MKSLFTRPTLFVILLSCIVAFSSCKKDEETNPTPIGNTGSGSSEALSAHDYLSGELIEANFRGRIVDENDQPISNVEVSIGTSTTSTDTEGIWQIIDVMVDTERAYIKAEKQGYFHGSRVLTPSGIGFNRAFITLMTAETAGTISSDTGGDVSHSSGSMVSLPADAYVDENGDAYSGMVDVQMTYLDPSDMDILDQMPGNLTALEADDDFVALLTYGMIGVELLGNGGESLQIASGAEAEIRMPVPAIGLANAPETIPLWHFDEEEGVWREDGTATLVGNEYVGMVSHFSFWNCDIPTDNIFLDGYAYGEEGAFPVQGVQIVIISEDFGNGYAYTDQDGYFGGVIPANVVLTMEIYSPCGTLLSSQEIGPFNSDVTIPVIAVFEEEYGVITGTLIDCGGEPGDGYITVNNFGYLPESFEVDDEGNFTMTYGCPPQDVELIGYSEDYLSNSGVIEVTTIAGQTVDVGNVDLCAFATDEYIIFEVLGETYTVVDSIFTSSGVGYLEIYGSQCGLFDCTWISFGLNDVPAPASTDFADTEVNYFSVGQTTWGFLDYDTPDMDWTFTTYSTVPEQYLEFTFSGTYSVQENGVETDEVVTGYGRVQRD